MSPKSTYSRTRTAHRLADSVEDKLTLTNAEFVTRSFVQALYDRACDDDFTIDVSDAPDDVRRVFGIVADSEDIGSRVIGARIP